MSTESDRKDLEPYKQVDGRDDVSDDKGTVENSREVESHYSHDISWNKRRRKKSRFNVKMIQLHCYVFVIIIMDTVF